jgi:hypothetical protein
LPRRASRRLVCYVSIGISTFRQAIPRVNGGEESGCQKRERANAARTVVKDSEARDAGDQALQIFWAGA